MLPAWREQKPAHRCTCCILIACIRLHEAPDDAHEDTRMSMADDIMHSNGWYALCKCVETRHQMHSFQHSATSPPRSVVTVTPSAFMRAFGAQ
eukprot:10246192-Prorocentrum_lima.AAC.1